MNINIIYNKNCDNMDDVDDESIDLIISGPPYWDLLDYNSFTNGKEFVWNISKSYEEFLDEFSVWYQECYRTLRPGRYCVINVATIRRKGRCYALPFHAVSALEEIGYDFCYEILWHKIAGGRRHARGVIQRPYPGYYIPNNRTEYLLVFKKNPRVPFCSDKKRQKSPLNKIDIDDLFKREIANNVWHLLPSSPEDERIHPCPFPHEIPFRLIKFLSLKGEVVLDPFMGIGTTARAATMLERKFIGYELNKEFIEYAKTRLNIPFSKRPDVVCKYEKL